MLNICMRTPDNEQPPQAVVNDIDDAYQKYRGNVNRCFNKKNRLGNPVLMKLSFDEWLQEWVKSGHWHERGKLTGQYVMTRIGDSGHYEVGNIVIIQRENKRVKWFWCICGQQSALGRRSA